MKAQKGEVQSLDLPELVMDLKKPILADIVVTLQFVPGIHHLSVLAVDVFSLKHFII